MILKYLFVLFWIDFPTLRSHLSAGVIHWFSVKDGEGLVKSPTSPPHSSALRGRGGNVGEGMALSGKTNQPPQKHGWNFMRHLKSTTYLTCVCRGLINPIRVKSTHGRGAHAFSVKSTQWKVNPLWAKHHVHATKHGSSSTKHHAGFARIYRDPVLGMKKTLRTARQTWKHEKSTLPEIALCHALPIGHTTSSRLYSGRVDLTYLPVTCPVHLSLTCLVTPPPTHFKQK